MDYYSVKSAARILIKMRAGHALAFEEVKQGQSKAELTPTACEDFHLIAGGSPIRYFPRT